MDRIGKRDHGLARVIRSEDSHFHHGFDQGKDEHGSIESHHLLIEHFLPREFLSDPITRGERERGLKRDEEGR